MTWSEENYKSDCIILEHESAPQQVAQLHLSLLLNQDYKIDKTVKTKRKKDLK